MGLVLAWGTPGQAARVPQREPTPLQERGAEVGKALLLEYYQELPQRKSGEKPAAWAERLQAGLEELKKKVAARYSEGTLQRLLESEHAPTRRAAVLALGLTGTMASNQAVAAMLYDEDFRVRRHSVDALWLLWFRGDKADNNRELQRLMRLAGKEVEGDDDGKALIDTVLAGLNALIKKAPRFAEAYNQRAILYFRAGDYEKAIADCEKVLKLNPYHFGAASGMARSYMNLKKPRAALKAYRHAYRINPGMEDVSEAIRVLEKVLGEEGKR
jgi:tetratricopeptide (TPR) repeat protein